MENIWLIIFVLFMISQVYQKVTTVKRDTQQQWDDEELTMDEIYPIEYEDETDPVSPKGMLDNCETLRKNVREFIPRDPEDCDKLTKKLQTQQDQQVNQKKLAKIKEEHKDAEQFMLQLDSTNLMNGIIISELLQPPKCKRQKPKIS